MGLKYHSYITLYIPSTHILRFGTQSYIHMTDAGYVKKVHEINKVTTIFPWKSKKNKKKTCTSYHLWSITQMMKDLIFFI